MQSSYLRLQPINGRSRSSSHNSSHASDSPGRETRLLHGFASSNSSLSGASSRSSSSSSTSSKGPSPRDLKLCRRFTLLPSKQGFKASYVKVIARP